MKNEYRIAVIPGDGVGMEIAKEAVRIGEKASKANNVSLNCEWFDWGCEYYLKHGSMMPENMLEILSEFDAIFLGCIGDATKVPDYISLSLLLT